MATTDEVITDLDAIAAEITAVRVRFNAQQSAIIGGSAALGDIPTKNPKRIDVLATINAFTPTGPFEALAQDKKALLETAFFALKAELDAVIAGF